MDLFARGVVELGSSQCEVTPFFVPKKIGRLRAIIDTRMAGRWFHDPPYTSLADAEAISSIESVDGERLMKKQSDVDCCFYQFEMPEGLRTFFRLPIVDGDTLTAGDWKRLGIEPRSGPLSFRVRVVPVGWSWAGWFIQSAMHHQLSIATGSPDGLLECRGPNVVVSGSPSRS